MAMHLNFSPLPITKKYPLMNYFPTIPSSQSIIAFQPIKANYHSQSVIARRTANYQPTIWDDSYIQTLPIDFMNEEHLRRRDKLKDEVRELIRKKKGLIEQLELIDALKQLGVSYHFEMEINDELSSINISMESINNKLENYSLNDIALHFRIQRENNHDALKPSVSDLVRSFKSMKGSHMSNLEHEFKGMLNLYEASYLAREGEDELDEAREFATNYIRNIREHISLLNPQLVEEIDHALDMPLHWRMPRLHSRWFINAYERQRNKNPTLLELAKLDFNIVQSVYKRELKEMSRWWRELGIVCNELSFARDRLVEHYLWAMAFTFEPKFSQCRKGITKIFCFISTIDDIYDVYGTLEELQLFTKVVDEWDKSALESLPNYMRICLVSLFNTMDEIANTISTLKKINVLPYLKQSWADLCKAYLTEARWYYTGYTPSLDDYLENAWLSISGILLLTSAYCLSDELTVESLNLISFYPNIVQQSCMLFRLYDDLGTSTVEIQRGDISKSIQCHMKEKNVSEAASRDYIKCLIIKYWKAFNKEYATNSNFESFKKTLIGIPRMAQCMYQHGDGHGEPNFETREQVISLIINPIEM